MDGRSPEDNNREGQGAQTRRRRETAALGVALAVMLIGSLAYAVAVWGSAGEVEISWHGYIAMGLGILLSVALAAGLMSLVFFSNRSGHDQRADWQPHHRPGRRGAGSGDPRSS